jgi:hypothetical protein
MDRDNPIAPKGRYKNGVTAALEICDTNRAQESGLTTAANGSGDKRAAIARTAAIVEAGAAKLNANDFTALEAVCASHVLALDVIFNEFARDAARVDEYLSRPSMATALRAQSQCRMMVNTLVGLHGRALSTVAKTVEKTKNSDERNIETANPPT